MSPFAPNTTSNEEWLRLVRLRMGLPIFAKKATCQCGHIAPTQNALASHILVCCSIRGFTAVHRHNKVVAALAARMEAFGLLVSVEPRWFAYEDGSKKRPDITVHIGGQTHTTDVTITDDMDRAMSQKLEKHGKAVNLANSSFTPFVMGIDGTFHSSALKFCSQVSKALPRSTAKLFRLSLLKSASEAWAEGTARLLSSYTTPDILVNDIDFENETDGIIGTN